MTPQRFTQLMSELDARHARVKQCASDQELESFQKLRARTVALYHANGSALHALFDLSAAILTLELRQ